jgi:hypothetical protein
MNRKQIICLWIGIVVVVLMGLFPPSYISNTYDNRKIEYMFLLNPTRFSVDISRLSVQWVVTAVITGGLILSFQSRMLIEKR